MYPSAECDNPLVVQGLGEIIHSVGAVAILCKGGKNPHMKKCFLNSYIIHNCLCRENISILQLELSGRQFLRPVFLLFVFYFVFLNFSQCSDRCLISVLGERGAVQTSVCFQQSVWKTLFLQSAALVIIGIQCISQPGVRKISPGVGTKACILNSDLEQNFRDFLLQKRGFHKRQSPKLK